MAITISIFPVALWHSSTTMQVMSSAGQMPASKESHQQQTRNRGQHQISILDLMGLFHAECGSQQHTHITVSCRPPEVWVCKHIGLTSRHGPETTHPCRRRSLRFVVCRRRRVCAAGSSTLTSSRSPSGPSSHAGNSAHTFISTYVDSEAFPHSCCVQEQ